MFFLPGLVCFVWRLLGNHTQMWTKTNESRTRQRKQPSRSYQIGLLKDQNRDKVFSFAPQCSSSSTPPLCRFSQYLCSNILPKTPKMAARIIKSATVNRTFYPHPLLQILSQTIKKPHNTNPHTHYYNTLTKQHIGTLEEEIPKQMKENVWNLV